METSSEVIAGLIQKVLEELATGRRPERRQGIDGLFDRQ